MKTVIPDGTNQVSRAGPDKVGWVVETIIEGQMAWVVEPVPGELYAFTFDFGKAHVFDLQYIARDTRAAIWCGLDRHGFHPHLDVVHLTDEYRASVARKAT